MKKPVPGAQIVGRARGSGLKENCDASGKTKKRLGERGCAPFPQSLIVFPARLRAGHRNFPSHLSFASTPLSECLKQVNIK